MKKLVALLSALLLTVTAFAGCKAGSGGGGALGDFKNRPKEVIVCYGANAYGKEWIQEIAKAYMTNHNTDTYVNPKQTVEQGSELAKVESGIATGDLYILDMHVEDKVYAFESIADVYTSSPIGEPNTTVREKYSDYAYNYYKNSGAQDFIMKKDNIGGYNFVYNKTVLDNIFGVDNYVLPRTTDEFIQLGNTLNGITDPAKKAYLMVCAFGDASNEYSRYMFNGWFAQLVGKAGYDNYRMGRYYDETSGKWLFDTTKPSVISENKDAIKDYYDILESIYSKQNKYVHADATAIGAPEAEGVMAGYGFGLNSQPAVFMVNGAYAQQEMGWMLEEQEAAGNKQEIRMMQVPVASKIIRRTPTIGNDEKLREVVTYVDAILEGRTATKPANVSDDDIAIVQEARTICAGYVAGGMFIPKCANNKEGAKDFIRYLASDEAAIIAAKYTNGINLLPFGKEVTEEELGFERTPFMADCMRIGSKTDYVCSSDSQEYLFAYSSGMGLGSPNSGIFGKLYNGTNTYTSESYYKEFYDYYNSRWSDIITDYENLGGDMSND